MDKGNTAIAAAAGAMGALLLGMALSPLRGLTPAANFSFAFVALTIAVAEWGGREAAVMSALVSALSLDFFLTEPYLQLSIARKDDLVAFVGLTLAGLVAAAFADGRGRRASTRRHLALLQTALRRLERSGTGDARLAETLDAACDLLPVAALALRDPAGRILKGTTGAASRPLPAVTLAADVLAPEEPLPVDGTRILLQSGARTLGSLDVWGNGEPASQQDRQTLIGVARIAAACLALGEISTTP